MKAQNMLKGEEVSSEQLKGEMELALEHATQGVKYYESLIEANRHIEKTLAFNLTKQKEVVEDLTNILKQRGYETPDK